MNWLAVLRCSVKSTTCNTISFEKNKSGWNDIENQYVRLPGRFICSTKSDIIFNPITVYSPFSSRICSIVLRSERY